MTTARSTPTLAAHQPPRAAELLIELDRASHQPLRRQLETRLRAGIQDGSLPDGTRLPSSRSLAEQLAEQLAVSPRRGRRRLRAADRPGVPRPPGPGRARCRSCEPGRPPGPASCSAPTRPTSACSRGGGGWWLRATAEAMRDLPNSELDYPADARARGGAKLRAALVGHLSRVRRVRVDVDNLILTLGFLHGLDLLFRSFALRGVRRVAVENPSVPEQLAIARAHGMKVRPIPVDQAGPVVADLLDTHAEAVIVTPAHQFPLGAVP